MNTATRSTNRMIRADAKAKRERDAWKAVALQHIEEAERFKAIIARARAQYKWHDAHSGARMDGVLAEAKHNTFPRRSSTDAEGANIPRDGGGSSCGGAAGIRLTESRNDREQTKGARA